MANLELAVNIPVVIAIVLAELMSVLYFNDRTPWGRRFGERYLVSAIVSDVGLVLLIQFVTKNYFSVSDMESAIKVALFFGLLYVCLEAPHCVHNGSSLNSFFFHACHKFLIVFVVAFSLFFFRDFKI